MCTDFTNLNKVCPKDYYPLPCLGRLVDVSARNEVFDFLDASRRQASSEKFEGNPGSVKDIPSAHKSREMLLWGYVGKVPGFHDK
ncbi:hypothetical protein LIER_23940 [Lithospermum erythrorhizon]|uniref:Uncharacterized protein n=1 Tax=Lithospermum erythrorhizon TaxID=34254 RepID=A0AAV3R2F0_LITER